jgi:hypothetical protein
MQRELSARFKGASVAKSVVRFKVWRDAGRASGTTGITAVSSFVGIAYAGTAIVISAGGTAGIDAAGTGESSWVELEKLTMLGFGSGLTRGSINVECIVDSKGDNMVKIEHIRIV